MNSLENNINIDRDVGVVPDVSIEQPTVDSLAMISEGAVSAEVPRAHADEVIIKGSTWAAIWHMSWPLFINMITIAVASFFDTYVAGRLGSSAQAAIGLCGQIWFFMVLLAVALSAGTNALVSRFWGEGDVEKTTQAARQSILFAVIFGAVSAGVGLLVCRPLLQLLGASPEVQRLGWDFLKFDLCAQLPFTLLWVTNSIFRAKGNARVPMVIMGLITLQVIVLDYCLCLGPLHVGISGIGMSWGIASILGVLLSFKLLRRSELAECLNLRLMLKETSWEWFHRLMKIGIPACVQDLSWVGGNFVLFLIFAHTSDPTACQASWAVGLRLEETLGGFPIYALSMALGTIVGQNLGAKQPDRAERIGWQVMTLGIAINTVVALVLVLGANQLAHLMSSDPKVIVYSVQYLQVVGMCEPFVAIWLILMGAMNGAGYTRWPMWATITGLTLIRLPLSWLLTVTLGWGPIGTWTAISLTCAFVGIIFIWRFNTGVWKQQQV
ncbi:MAG TPA: MATE family efflux transporter [Candidatus Obscuribacterales bacterium]